MAKRLLTAEHCAAISNALSACASRWNEWAGELALPDVAQTFREQAAEAMELGEWFSQATEGELNVED